jgi:hypothetical protein
MPEKPSRLRVVARDEKPAAAPKVSPRTVSQAAKDGDARELLAAMRDRIALAVESPTTAPRDLAALSRRLIEIAKEIEAIDLRAKQEDEGAEVDDERFDAASV